MTCGSWCKCYLPGTGEIGKRRCRLNHFDERRGELTPRLTDKAEIIQPNECRRVNPRPIPSKETLLNGLDYPGNKDRLKYTDAEPIKYKPEAK